MDKRNELMATMQCLLENSTPLTVLYNPDGSTVMVGYDAQGKESYRNTRFEDGGSLVVVFDQSGKASLQAVTNADGSLGSKCSTFADRSGVSRVFAEMANDTQVRIVA